jgi:quercetin dioxygenase-like cupin family protein
MIALLGLTFVHLAVAQAPASPPGAALPVHEHRSPRYAYVLSGRVELTGDDGRVSAYEAGAFIVEMGDTWHRGSNPGDEPARLLVIDQVEPGTSNTILREAND